MSDDPHVAVSIGAAFLNFGLARFASFSSFAWSEMLLIWDVEEELRKLERTFFKIQELAGLIDGCPLRFYVGSNAWQLWFEDMLKLSYDADGLLDEVGFLISDHCANQDRQQRQVFSMIITSPLSNWKLAHNISKMQMKLDALAKEMESLVMIENIKLNAKIPTSGKSLPFPLTSSFTGVIVGRENDKRRIVDLLGSGTSSSSFSVISVTGMGGIGKTAIAHHVYDDDNVRRNFNLRVWVSVSVEFDMIKITKSMIEYASVAVCNLSDLDSLQLKLQRLLCGRKFLLVLDDYWSEECEDWDSLSWPFRSGSPGSKVIVTTRSMKVSTVVSSSEPYILNILSDDDCWEVIKQRSRVSVGSSMNLESVGRQIAKKCQGMPLIATMLGNMLRGGKKWHFVLQKELWGEEAMFLRLIQSYIYLPPHLQKCFAYCSIFPQGYVFEKNELALLWAAEGFVNVPQGDQTLVDLARGYFKDLRLRFVFEKCKNRKKSYKMHDLMHGMARLVSKDICFHIGKLNNSYPLFGNACHLSLLHDSKEKFRLEASMKNERLRTFLLMRNNKVHKIELHAQLFSHLKHLRVLGLGGAGLEELVDSVSQLIYLRYLNVSHNPISKIPQSMGKLKALHTLKLGGCHNLHDLPVEMINLINLRHLDMDNKTDLPPQFGKLANLEYLSAKIVDGKKYAGRGIGELKSMNCLRTLCITNINEVESENEAKEAELGLKTRLDKLELQWNELTQGDLAAKVLDALKPHTNLKKLVIQKYCGVVYPAWLSDSLRSFTSIELKGLEKCNHLPSLGELPSLESFVIAGMPCLTLVDHNLYGTNNKVQKFPSLKRFELRGLSHLARWEVDDKSYPDAMPHLKELTIDDCPNLSFVDPIDPKTTSNVKLNQLLELIRASSSNSS